MPNHTNNFGLTYLSQNQIAKDIVINQNMQIIDSVMYIKAIDCTATPATNPSEGDVYLIANSGASGAWVGFDKNIAVFQNGSWVFIAPAKNSVCNVLYWYGRLFFDGYNWKPADNMMKIGDYKLSAQTSDHDNWLLCNGRAISRTSYAQLFRILGTRFSAGDGSTTFGVPQIAANSFAQNCFLFAGLV